MAEEGGCIKSVAVVLHPFRRALLFAVVQFWTHNFVSDCEALQDSGCMRIKSKL
jgi:hypothetical protein